MDEVIARISRAEALARRLEQEITSRGLPPGWRLGTKKELRERFGVAVGTLNEAVRLMEMRGLVAARPGPGGGLFVASVSDQTRLTHTILGLDWGRATLGDCLEMRNALEPLVCRRAARHHEDEDMRDLRALLAALEASTGDPHGWFRANWALHRRIAAVGGNVPLQSVYLAIVSFLEGGLDDFEFQGNADVAAIHRELLDAIEAGEGPRLERAIAAHMEASPLPSA
jgi:DNA-binding FadR family transcriptional regulator